MEAMREISPAQNLSAEEYLAHLSPPFRALVLDIRAQKKAGQRPRPSTGLVDRSTLLTSERRRQIVHAVATLVDENLTGRADMCLQFAMLLQRGLAHLGLPARLVLGNGIYPVDDRQVFRWRHAWVRVGPEVIDGNVDAVVENPAVPRAAVAVVAVPYWGPITKTPPGRRFQERQREQQPPDEDVEATWWPDLRARLDAPVSAAPLEASPSKGGMRDGR